MAWSGPGFLQPERLQRWRERFPRVSRVGELAWQVGRSALKHNALEFASALAYTAFFALVPMLALLGVVVGALVRRTSLDTLLLPLLEQAPEATRVVVLAGLHQLADTDLRVAPLMFGGFLWVASSGAHGAMDILEIVLVAPPRSWLRKRLLSLAWVIGVLLTVGLTLGIVVKATARVEDEAVSVREAEHQAAPPASASDGAAVAPPPSAPLAEPELDGAAHRAIGVEALPAIFDPSRGVPMLRRRLVLVGSALSGSVTLAALLALAFFALAGFYRTGVRYDPNDEAGDKRRVYPGAWLALIGCFVVSSAFGLYVARFGRYVTYYGGLATVAVLLLWLQLTAFAFLLGAELNAVLEGRRLHSVPISARRAAERHAAYAALRAEAAALEATSAARRDEGAADVSPETPSDVPPGSR